MRHEPRVPPQAFLALALALVLGPACGHKGPPRAPRRTTPPSLADFRLAQRGDTLEVSFTAPAASVDGVAFRSVEVEIFWGEGQVDLEKAGQRRSVEVRPGARVVEELPLPAPGTLVRAAARAVSGRSQGQRSLIRALQAQAPLIPPRELGVGLREKGVTLTWKGAMPQPVEPPDLAPGSPFRDRNAPRPPGARRDRAGGEPEEPGAEAGPEESDDPGPGGAAAPDKPPAGAAASTTTADPEAKAGVEDPAAEVAAAKKALPPIHGFRVYRRLDPGAWGEPLNFAPQARRVFTDAHVPLGRTACYVVRAVGSVDPQIESAPSNEACVEVRDIVPPEPPSGLAVIPREGGLEVVWSPSPDAGLASYRVYRAPDGAPAEQVAEISAGTTTWIDTTGAGGILYGYTVTAVDGAGNEGPPSGSAEGIRQ